MDSKKITKDEQIKILTEELKRKDKIIQKLKEEKELLFKLSIKTTNKILDQKD
jgi:hypothetical protein